MSIASQSAESARVRRRIAELLEPLRTAPTVGEALQRCADLIEARPGDLLSTDVHLLIEACAGLGTEGADALQDAAGMHRAYQLAELPYGKQCALLAVMRLRAVRGQVASGAATIQRAATATRVERYEKARRMLAAGETAEEIARVGRLSDRTVRRWKAELREEAAAA